MKEDRRYTSVFYSTEFEATLHATLENILDVPHTAFLHRGLFRGVKRNEITAVVRRGADRVEALTGPPTPAVRSRGSMRSISTQVRSLPWKMAWEETISETAMPAP